jgi:hypothetical protein
MADSYVVIDTVSGRAQAEMLKSYLNAQGVPCEVSQEAAGQLEGLTFGPLGSADLLVPSHHARQARELLKEFHRASHKKDG